MNWKPKSACKLVDRTTREVQLTDVGANLVGSVSRLLTDLDEALREIRDLGEQRRGRVIVGGESDGGVPADAGRDRALASRFPLISLSLRDDVQSDVLRQVKSGEVGFRRRHRAVRLDDLHGEMVMTDSFCVVVRHDHPLARAREVAVGGAGRASGS